MSKCPPFQWVQLRGTLFRSNCDVVETTRVVLRCVVRTDAALLRTSCPTGFTESEVPFITAFLCVYINSSVTIIAVLALIGF